jgi:hypothetical protein
MAKVVKMAFINLSKPNNPEIQYKRLSVKVNFDKKCPIEFKTQIRLFFARDGSRKKPETWQFFARI